MNNITKKLRIIGATLLIACSNAVSVNSAIAAEAVLDSQPGPNGLEVQAVRAKVNGSVLTIAVKYVNTLSKVKSYKSYATKDVYYIAGQKKYQVLKDEKGNWLASPMSSGDHVAGGWVQSESSDVVWFKFPAPPADVTSIEFQIPEVAPFTLPLQR